MARVLLFLMILLNTFSVEAQDEFLYFSEALAMHLPKYTAKAQDAYQDNNPERAQFLFDSLVNNCLKGSYLDNFKVKNLNNKTFPLKEVKKPIYLITNASWIVPTEGEIPALNELAKKYEDKIAFVILFWDDHKTAKKLAKKYDKSIEVLFVDELGNESNNVVHNLKHSLGVPTSFLLNEDKKVIDIRRCVSHVYGLNPDESFAINHKAFSEGISRLLLNDSSNIGGHSVLFKLP